MDRIHQDHRSPRQRDETNEELRALRREIIALRKTFDEFAGTFLNAKFPYGKPSDRWRRH